MTFHKAATLDDIWSGEKIAVEICGKPVLLVNVEGVICAYEDRCRHKGIPLSQGRLQNHVLTCSAHGWEYDARSGRGINPDRVHLRTYPVTIEGNDILVDIAGELKHETAGAEGDATSAVNTVLDDATGPDDAV